MESITTIYYRFVLFSYVCSRRVDRPRGRSASRFGSENRSTDNRSHNLITEKLTFLLHLISTFFIFQIFKNWKLIVSAGLHRRMDIHTKKIIKVASLINNSWKIIYPNWQFVSTSAVVELQVTNPLLGGRSFLHSSSLWYFKNKTLSNIVI